MLDLTTSQAFLDSLFSYVHGKGGEAGYDDQRPAMMAAMLALDPSKALLMEACDIAAIFSTHLHGNVHSGVIDQIETNFEYAEEDELNTRLEGLLQSGRVSLTANPKRKDVGALVESIKSVPGGSAFLARVAIHLHHGRRSKRAAVHMLTLKES